MPITGAPNPPNAPLGKPIPSVGAPARVTHAEPFFWKPWRVAQVALAASTRKKMPTWGCRGAGSERGARGSPGLRSPQPHTHSEGGSAGPGQAPHQAVVQGQPAEIGVPVALGVQAHRQPCEESQGLSEDTGAVVGGLGMDRTLGHGTAPGGHTRRGCSSSEQARGG